jgi:hypothetical protein
MVRLQRHLEMGSRRWTRVARFFATSR